MKTKTKSTGLAAIIKASPKQLKSSEALEKSREILTKLFKEKKIKPI